MTTVSCAGSTRTAAPPSRYLREWLATRKPHLAPNTYAGYAACVERDLVPAFGHLRLLDLRPEHIDDWVTAQLEAKRGRVTVHRAVSTLRNALNAAVRSWRLRYNPAKHSVPPKPRATERTCWTPEQAATFLQHGAEQYADQLTDLFEVMLGTGMRRGEILALRWSDVHLMDRKRYVRRTLAAIEQEKAMKFNALLTNAVIFHNALDIAEIVRQLLEEGWEIDPADSAHISSYLTEHINRFGECSTHELGIQPDAYDPKLDVDFIPLREQDLTAAGLDQAA
ncbi:Tn3 family transposase [Kitasatospora purpeofusca]|uniref:tyrosine-type recombinase/integrase n=1 Tax=Kitasatospora purpeofusca TaxID=67352 RepID=UPI002254EC61|nr:Tn3 family transposase [Kitasatospora purpeofusca]MCX4688624.1 Tn3 family transposase [Kitasatospora purpeofusca]